MKKRILTATALLIVPLASGCVRASAATTQMSSSAAPASSFVIGVAGDCPSGAGPMLAAPRGAAADRNGDGYVCEKQIVSINGRTLRVLIDDDAAPRAAVEMAFYSGM